MRKRKVVIGRTYGRLRVVAEAGRQNYKLLWECKCKCGNTLKVLQPNLLQGHTRSCGCLRGGLKVRRILSIKNTKHGMSNTPEHKAWRYIRHRCPFYFRDRFTNKAVRVDVCRRWKNSFVAFYQDVGKMPNKGCCHIKRIDERRNYEPGNCKWVPWKYKFRWEPPSIKFLPYFEEPDFFKED
jgi:hypothetical protein